MAHVTLWQLEHPTTIVIVDVDTTIHPDWTFEKEIFASSIWM